ncbi:hypothetical protein SPBR_05482 [Sporothrix brasiliensis 5110]|uniref:GRIP domain-containing protein n=1 Tax=Sporothrix brasiliensis 5110 TaxID=1398154 RepID=A0A0C2J4X0_9PEZI|nr:uncharacterized protein SPBR_05482 [Sporothrix brasiliensis 5110]KIH94070.1 hypothetical protein SPBR_05482 [Sporothrix brasiliensis 5110]
MFQRIRGAIDRTIAEEQARQQRASEGVASPGSASPSRRSTSVSRTGSARGDGQAARRTRPKKPSQDTSTNDGVPNVDPSVFEDAFALEDNDEPARSATPGTPAAEGADDDDEDEAKEGGEAEGKAGGKDKGKSVERRSDEDDQTASAASAATAGLPGDTSPPSATDTPKGAPAAVAPRPKAELTPDVQARLRKLDKLEKTYPELLRSYRIAHGRVSAIEPFERALRENTPLTSIRDPTALIEYLNQLSLKSEMILDELKRVTSDRDDLKKQLGLTKDELDAVKSSKADAKDVAKGPEETRGEEFFSIDSELPRLQAETAEKTAEIEKLQDTVQQLNEDLSAAKEANAELAERVQSTTKELDASKAGSMSHAALADRLQDTESKLKALEDQSADAQSTSEKELHAEKEKRKASETRNSELARQVETLTAATAKLDKTIADQTSEIASLTKQNAEQAAKVAELSRRSAATASPANATPAAAAAAPEPSTEQQTGGGSGKNKKKNKKKKNAGGAAGGAAAAATTAATAAASLAAADEPALSETSERTLVGGASDGPDAAELQAEVARLLKDVEAKDERIQRLSKQRKTEEDLREEIETLRENLVTIGQDHVQDKETIKSLESEKAALVKQIAELEKQIASSSSTSQTQSTQLQAALASLQKEHDDAKAKATTLQADLGAAQQLSQTRYKELASLREILQKAQPELKSLRADAATLKTTQEELATKTAEMRALEKREREAKLDTARAQRLAADRDAELKALRDKLAAETNAKLRLEDEKRVAGRDLRRAEADKIELSAKEEKATRALQRLQEELAAVQPRLRALDDEVGQLRREQEALRAEAALKTSQYTNAQHLLGSMRDQTAELSVQLREAQAQAEARDEELAECQTLLAERTRAAESMRQLLAGVNEQTDSKVRDMRARMDAALEERDRVEDEANTLARRRAREAEDLRGKVRDLERQVRALTNERDDAEQREKDWRRRREELEQVEAKAAAEVEDMRATVASLRTALDASEQQVRDVEKKNSDQRRVLDEQRQRYEKLLRDAKGQQGRLHASSPSPSPSPSSPGGARSSSVAAGADGARHSMESARSSNGTPAAAGADAMYLKTILLQFLEQKDNKLRAQLFRLAFGLSFCVETGKHRLGFRAAQTAHSVEVVVRQLLQLCRQRTAAVFVAHDAVRALALADEKHMAVDVVEVLGTEGLWPAADHRAAAWHRVRRILGAHDEAALLRGQADLLLDGTERLGHRQDVGQVALAAGADDGVDALAERCGGRDMPFLVAIALPASGQKLRLQLVIRRVGREHKRHEAVAPGARQHLFGQRQQPRVAFAVTAWRTTVTTTRVVVGLRPQDEVRARDVVEAAGVVHVDAGAEEKVDVAFFENGGRVVILVVVRAGVCVCIRPALLVCRLVPFATVFGRLAAVGRLVLVAGTGIVAGLLAWLLAWLILDLRATGLGRAVLGASVCLRLAAHCLAWRIRRLSAVSCLNHCGLLFLVSRKMIWVGDNMERKAK